MDAISGIIAGLIIAFVSGLIIGCLAECSKWRANADADNAMRLYSKGRLYKVAYADVEPVVIAGGGNGSTPLSRR